MISGKQITLIVLLGITAVSLLLAYFFGGILLAIAMTAVCTALFIITQSIWHSEGRYTYLIRISALGVAILLITANTQLGFWNNIMPILIELLKQHFPKLDLTKISVGGPSIEVSILATVIVLAVLYVTRDKTVMGEIARPIDKDFPEKDFQTRLHEYCTVLTNELDNLDYATNWSDFDFVPLDAEVEIKSGPSKKRKVTDLIKALKSDKISRTFLVLGDPGSGKSVALRRLTRALLKEVNDTGRIPLYINLREWHHEHIWDDHNPATQEQLYAFVKKSLKGRNSSVDKFIDKYFDKMYDYGRVFFIFDSFDEIPQVMDAKDNTGGQKASPIIDNLSTILYGFLTEMTNSRGVLASRIFRKPSTAYFRCDKELEIRPLTERKIELLFKRQLNDINKLLATHLFKERRDLVPAARNPFTASLILQYLDTHSNNLPRNQAEVYNSYVQTKLWECKDTIQRKGLTISEIYAHSVEIAYFCFVSDRVGLEVGIDDLKRHLFLDLERDQIENILYCLSYTKIGRLSATKRFSFVHRRFNEYFLVQKLINDHNLVSKDSIPTDSRFRDALVLYCEVAHEENVKEIANFCWSRIKDFSNIQYNTPAFLETVHCLRFLTDAYKQRRYLLEDFNQELVFILKSQFNFSTPHLTDSNPNSEKANSSQNILQQKIAIEATGILEDSDIDSIVVSAFKTNNSWLQEVAFKSCRHLPQISEKLSGQIITYIDNLDIFTIVRQKSELSFNLSLTDGFKNIKSFFVYRIISICLAIIGLCILVLVIPTYWICLYFLGALAVTLFNTVFLLRGNVNEIYRTVEKHFRTIIALHSILLITVPSKIIVHTQLVKYMNTTTFIILHLLGVLLITDWYGVVKFTKTLRTNLLKALKSIVTYMIIILLSTAVGLIYLAINYFPKQYLNYVSIFLYIIFPFYMVYLLKEPIKFHLFSLWKENAKYKNAYRFIKCHDKISRAWIATCFQEITNPLYKTRIIRALETKTGIDEWPTGSPPNHNNDEASIRLAKLEERWLGLDK